MNDVNEPVEHPVVEVARVGLQGDGMGGATGKVVLADWVEVLPGDQAAAIIRHMAEALECEAEGFEFRAHMAEQARGGQPDAD